jgi:hypothetical protein
MSPLQPVIESATMIAENFIVCLRTNSNRHADRARAKSCDAARLP